MNIIDMLGGIQKETNNSLSNKIAVKSEIRKIEKMADDFADYITNRIAYESRFIESGCSYGGQEISISEEDKRELNKKLEEIVRTIPSKISSTINEIFGSSSEEKKEEPKEVEKKVEVAVAQPTAVPIVTPSQFGY